MKPASCFIIIIWILGSCGSDDPGPAPVFTNLPAAVTDIQGLVPLGNLNPSGHVFPTDHMYIYLKNISTPSQVYIPGSMTLTTISLSEHHLSNQSIVTDYQLYFSSGKYNILIDHVLTLESTLSGKVGDFSNASCSTYSTGNETVTRCQKQVNIPVQGGQLLGTAGGSASRPAFDFGIYLNQVALCPLDYFTGDAKQNAIALLGDAQGISHRTAEPICGTVNQDLTGTVQGNWIKEGLPRNPEDPNVALVHDNINPALPRFSIGNSIPGLNSGVYGFTPAVAGTVNRDFSKIPMDGTIYCFDNLFQNSVPVANKIILVSGSGFCIKVEAQSQCGCSCITPVFTQNAVRFCR